MKRIFLAVLLGLALGVYGCGGGGGGEETADSGAGGADTPEAPAEAPAKEAPAEEAPAEEAPAKEAPAPVAETEAPAADGTVKIGILHSL